MINVIASIKLKAGHRAQFVEIFKANVLQEPGCLECIPTVDCQSGIAVQQLDENVVTIIEKWESVAALHRHLATSHMLAYKAAVADIVDSVALRILAEV